MNFRSKLKIICIALLAITFSFINGYHQSTMFENDRHFSHLSTLEREMTFRTEMGLYYHYFKVMVEASSVWSGIKNIMSDNRTEYPLIINTLQRFNLYPEVLLSMGYKTFIKIADIFQIKTKECWTVLRGDEMPPITSCEGLGEPSYFYVTSVFILNGLVGGIIFLYGTYLSESVLGGIISEISFLFNHGECTRVQWTPPLRESFGYPVFLLQMLIVSITIRNADVKRTHVIIIGILTSIFILFWQFAQFALLTQVLAVFSIYTFGLVSVSTFRRFLKGHIFGFLIALGFLFWNKMLLVSFYSSALIVAYIITIIDKQLKIVNVKLLLMFIQGTLFCIGSFLMKIFLSCILNVSDDVHIWNLLRSKLSSYKDFHTMLYTCAAEFDFLEFETFIRLTETLLLPICLFVMIMFPIKLFLRSETAHFDDAHIIYNLLQTLVFFIMAFLVMRLKLFFTPHLCLIASLIVCRKIFHFDSKIQYRYALVVVLISIMAVKGVQNIHYQRSIIGEFSNPELEELLTWIKSSTDPDAVFGGPMPTMASILLSTNRPVVNHPHYENAALRNRTYHVYQIFSRKPVQEVYEVLKSMKVEYIVIGKKWCFGKSREGCAMTDVWDIEDKQNIRQRPLCLKLTVNPYPFYEVFRNSDYFVLKL